MLAHNASLYHLNLSLNKISRPGLLGLGKSVKTNTGLITLDLTGLRVDGAVTACFIEAFEVNFTLCKLIWDPEVKGYNLKFTELLNRNSEIEHALKEGKDHLKFLPENLRENPPALVPRIVPDPDEDECAPSDWRLDWRLRWRLDWRLRWRLDWRLMAYEGV